MRYLVTGGAGFIGSHLSESLLARGHEVLVMDDLSTGSITNIEHLKNEPGFSYIVETIDNEPILAEWIDKADAVFHLAAAVGVKLIVESPVRTIETNITGTEKVLKHASKKGKKVLVASTSEVYGKGVEVPFNEEGDLLLGPTTRSRWSYAASKIIDEFLALSYHRERGLPIVIARIFNTVGPRQTGRYGMVVPRFVGQALDGGPITIYGDGGQSRCFCYVGDTARGLVDLMESEGAVGGVFNVGSDEEITIEDLAERVRELVDPSVELAYIPYEEAYAEGFEDMRRRVPDLTKIRDEIGLAITVGIDEILEMVIGYERRRRGWETKT